MSHKNNLWSAEILIRDGVTRRNCKATSLVGQSNFSPTSLYNGKDEVVEWRKREISLLSPRHYKTWINVQSRKCVRTGGESGKRGAVTFLLQTDDGLDLLSETKQLHYHDCFKATNKWGELKTSCGPTILAILQSRTSYDLQLHLMWNTRPWKSFFHDSWHTFTMDDFCIARFWWSTINESFHIDECLMSGLILFYVRFDS